MYVYACSSCMYICMYVYVYIAGNIQFNDVVVVSGCGPLGLGMVHGDSLTKESSQTCCDELV